MAILIVVAANQQSQQNMHKIFKRDAPDLVLGKPASNIFLMKNNGRSLKYAWAVKERNPFYVDVYFAEELHERQIPEPVRRAAAWKKKQGFGRYPASEETLRKEGLPSQEELEKVELQVRNLY